MKKLVKTFVVLNMIGYSIYKLKLDEKLIRAIEPGFREFAGSFKK
ncbi:MAG: hypothetical protein ACI8WT_004499 [Clostridium sp.]|jgi:hypothetical protein